MSNADIPVFITYVRSEYLHLQEHFTPATVFAISSIQNQNPTFQILADDKTHFNNIPTSALANSKTALKLTEEDCVYCVCPDENIIINQYDYLSTLAVCGVWKRDNSFWQNGTYMFSIEWKSGTVLHLIELEDGNYILWPSDKLTWNDAEK